MTFLYLVAALIVNLSNVGTRFTEGINVCFNSSLSGVAIFWIGLLTAFVLGWVA